MGVEALGVERRVRIRFLLLIFRQIGTRYRLELHSGEGGKGRKDNGEN